MKKKSLILYCAYINWYDEFKKFPKDNQWTQPMLMAIKDEKSDVKLKVTIEEVE